MSKPTELSCHRLHKHDSHRWSGVTGMRHLCPGVAPEPERNQYTLCEDTEPHEPHVMSSGISGREICIGRGGIMVLEDLFGGGKTLYVLVDDDGRCVLRTHDQMIEHFTI